MSTLAHFLNAVDPAAPLSGLSGEQTSWGDTVSALCTTEAAPLDGLGSADH